MKKKKRDLDIRSGETSNIFVDEQQSWLTSYSDIITILLCFFMIFYSAEKGTEKSSYMDVIADLKQDFNTKLLGVEKGVGIGKGLGTSPGVGEGTGTGIEGEAEKQKAEMQKAVRGILVRAFDEETVVGFENIDKRQGISVYNNRNYVSVMFEGISFFQKGSTVLTKDAADLLANVVDWLKPYQDKIFVNIVGHTDQQKVHMRNTKWWKNNVELSAARALSVYHYFTWQGFSEDSAYISGAGTLERIFWNKDANETLSLKGKGLDDVQFEKMSRRITLRIEPKI